MAAVDLAEVPDTIVRRLRDACARLPEAVEERTFRGPRWRVRKRTFADVLRVDDGTRPVTLLVFRSTGTELEVLQRSGHPFFPIRGRDVVGMVLDEDTDWDEVAELLTESFCLLAPKKLVALVDRPD